MTQLAVAMDHAESINNMSVKEGDGQEAPFPTKLGQPEHLAKHGFVKSKLYPDRRQGLI